MTGFACVGMCVASVGAGAAHEVATTVHMMYMHLLHRPSNVADVSVAKDLSEREFHTSQAKLIIP